MSKFDPITLEILWRRLISIVDEADSTVSRTAFSSLLRDAHDYTCMFTDRKGRELAQGTFATPGQSGAMALGIKKLVKKLPADTFKPGDVFITNDPWALAGHLNDVCVISPIFYKKKLTAFTACVFHHSDIGGRVSSDNHDVYEDGLFIPLVKLYEKGEPNQAVFEMIRYNVRTPDAVIGDIRSQIAANHVCAEKIGQMLDEYQLKGLDDLADEIIGRTEESMRDAIFKIPDGVYTSEGVIEQMEGREDVVIKAAVKVEGSDITVDLAGSSGHVDWGGNVVYNFTYAYVFMAIKSIFDPDIPNNDGCTAPISMRLGGQLHLPGGGGRPDADRPLPDRDRLPGPGRSGARPGDRRQRRNPGDHERLLREEKQRGALPLCDHPRRRHGRQLLQRRLLRLHLPRQRGQHPGGDLRKRHAADSRKARAALRLRRPGEAARRLGPPGGFPGPRRLLRPAPAGQPGHPVWPLPLPARGPLRRQARGQGQVLNQRPAGQSLRPHPAESR
jgi:hypothetical protein